MADLPPRAAQSPAAISADSNAASTRPAVGGCPTENERRVLPATLPQPCMYRDCRLPAAGPLAEAAAAEEAAVPRPIAVPLAGVDEGMATARRARVAARASDAPVPGVSARVRTAPVPRPIVRSLEDDEDDSEEAEELEEAATLSQHYRGGHRRRGGRGDLCRRRSVEHRIESEYAADWTDGACRAGGSGSGRKDDPSPPPASSPLPHAGGVARCRYSDQALGRGGGGGGARHRGGGRSAPLQPAPSMAAGPRHGNGRGGFRQDAISLAPASAHTVLAADSVAARHRRVEALTSVDTPSADTAGKKGDPFWASDGRGADPWAKPIKVLQRQETVNENGNGRGGMKGA